MKKAKIMLIAIMILGIFGVAMAVKVQRFNNIIYTTSVYGGDCRLTVHATTVTSGTSKVYWTSVFGALCTNYSFTAIDQ
jgi:hypothetical protein